MGGWGIKGLETRVTRECSISRGGQIVQWRYTSRRSPRREESQCYGRGGSSKSESCQELLERESCEHLRWTHLEQVQYCTDLPRQVTFPAHTEQGKMGPGLG